MASLQVGGLQGERGEGSKGNQWGPNAAARPQGSPTAPSFTMSSGQKSLWPLLVSPSPSRPSLPSCTCYMHAHARPVLKEQSASAAFLSLEAPWRRLDGSSSVRIAERDFLSHPQYTWTRTWTGEGVMVVLGLLHLLPPPTCAS